MDSKKWSMPIFLAFLFIASTSAEFLIQQVTKGRGTVYNTSNTLEANLGVTRELREERPSSKLVTITSFSKIKDRREKYESSIFPAAGYHWRLVLFVNGNPNDGGSGHISLYARIEEIRSFPIGWEADVDLKLFIYNGKQYKYLTVTDGAVKRFTDAKREWGFGQLIPLSTFNNANEGYLVQDTASFGAEIANWTPVQVQEKVTFITNPQNNVFTWKITHFSALEDKMYESEDFLVANRNWKLRFNPKGEGGGRGKSLPITICAWGFVQNTPITNTWGAVNLRLKNQRNSNHKQVSFANWYSIGSGAGPGVDNIITFQELNDASKGYLVNDAIIFEAEMVETSVTNIVPA